MSIENFLVGYDDDKYISSIQIEYANNEAYVLYDLPNGQKPIKRDNYRPFWFMRELPDNVKFYDNDPKKLRKAMRSFGVKVIELRHDDKERLKNGFRFLIELKNNGTHRDLTFFFKNGGIEPKGKHKDYFIIPSMVDQYMIQNSKRYFKGYDSYEDIHKLYYDIETTGLNAEKDRIFLIGARDNRGNEKIFDCIENDDESELNMIFNFFQFVEEIKPSVFAGYNSEGFDMPFIIKRIAILSNNLGISDKVELKDIIKTRDRKKKFYRREARVKFGNMSETYMKSIMWGVNVIDVIHGVRRMQAANSEIKNARLKYICKFLGVAKPNRIYVNGADIYKIWHENKDYVVNWKTGDYKLYDEHSELDGVDGYMKGNGHQIITKYLLDDLWETEQVDNSFTNSGFLLNKYLPTHFERACTMGTAATWQLLFLAWSYENRIAIPLADKKRDFTGGLSRVLDLGYAKDICKLDFDSLYPSEMLTYDIFPSVDVDGIMKQMLLYFFDKRNEYKELKNKYKAEGNKKMASFYDNQQLPFKIFNNSLYGSLTSVYFNWGEFDLGEQVTCTARQFLRSVVQFFVERGYKPLVLDTDGVNFSMPDGVKDRIYVGKGNHRYAEKDKTYLGVEADVAEYNDIYMRDYMGLGIDEICDSTINFSKKNYANLFISNGKTKIKMTGNTVKSKALQGFLEEFMSKGMEYLLLNDGKSFVKLYNKTIEILHSGKMPLRKIATKRQVKLTLPEYLQRKTKVNKTGGKLPDMPHMELALEHKLTPRLGDWIYLVNSGSKKSDSDVGNSYIVKNNIIEDEMDETGPYNKARYINIFNKRIEPLLVVFKPCVRETLLVTHPDDKQFYTDEEIELVGGMDVADGEQGSLSELLTMADGEVKFWDKIGMSPDYMFPKESNVSFDKRVTQELDIFYV